MPEPLDAFFLPPSLLGKVKDFSLTEFDSLAIRTPAVTPALVDRVADHLLHARDDYLAEKPVLEIVNAIDRAIGMWLDAASPYRQLASQALPLITRYSPEMIRTALPEVLSPFRKEGLLELLRLELGDPLYLDCFRPRGTGSGMARAYGPAMITHVFSGNIPGLPVASLIYGLLAKAANLGKSTLREPLMPALFARSLQEIDPRLADCIAVLPWKGGDVEIEREAFSRSQAVIAYGSQDSLREIWRRLPPGIRFLGYGTRLSFGVIAREALSLENGAELAARAARDVALFDQQGCLSPHLFYVENGGDTVPRAFAELLSLELGKLEQKLPRGRLSAEEAIAIQGLRGSYQFQELAGKDVSLYQSRGNTAWTVIYEESSDFVPSCLNRVVRVKPLVDLSQLPLLLKPVQEYLQTVAVEAGPHRLLSVAETLGRLDVSRICRIGEMQHPPASWHHDGLPNISHLLRWVDMEP